MSVNEIKNTKFMNYIEEEIYFYKNKLENAIDPTHDKILYYKACLDILDLVKINFIKYNEDNIEYVDGIDVHNYE